MRAFPVAAVSRARWPADLECDCHCALCHQQHRAGGVFQHAQGGAAKHQLSDGAMAERPHHDQSGFVGIGRADDLPGGLAAGDLERDLRIADWCVAGRVTRGWTYVG